MASVTGPSADIKHVFRGTFIHSTHKAPLQILEDSLLGVDAEGKVSSLRSSLLNLDCMQAQGQNKAIEEEKKKLLLVQLGEVTHFLSRVHFSFECLLSVLPSDRFP